MKRLFRLMLLSLLTLSLAACAPSIPKEEFHSDAVSLFSSEEPDSGTNTSSSSEEPDSGIDSSSSSEEPDSGIDSPSSSKEPDSGIDASSSSHEETLPSSEAPDQLPEDGSYTSKEDVALYIHLYGCLPSNFITKKEAEALGWKGGSLEPYASGMCIGGNRFGNYEGLLPEKDGRSYTECDIDTLGADKRGSKRIVFSNDGLIYYTEDHYESFELLYGEE